MLQLINKYKLYFYIFSFLFLSTIINNNILKIIKQNFLIKDILIETNIPEIDKKIFNEIKYLFSKNIFLINKNNIFNEIGFLNFLDNIHIKKKYPSPILIKASKTNIIGMTYINEKKYYVGSNGQFILSENLSVKKKLPHIFGNFQIQNYLELLLLLDDNNIKKSLITKYYFHKNKRWDLFLDNNILIKLPNTNIDKAIKNYKSLEKLKKVRSNSIIDLRIENRIVIENDQS